MKIEKNIPIPAREKFYSKYPWNQMEVGDSFLVPIKDRRRVSQAAGASSRAHGMKYVTRTLKDGVRVWRVA